MGPWFPPMAGRKETDGLFSAKTEEGKHGNDDNDQTDDIDDGIHGEDSS